MLELVGFFVLCIMFFAILFLSWRNQQRINDLYENTFQMRGGAVSRKIASVVSNVNYNDAQLYAKADALRLDLQSLSDSLDSLQSSLNRQINRINAIERTLVPGAVTA